MHSDVDKDFITGGLSTLAQRRQLYETSVGIAICFYTVLRSVSYIFNGVLSSLLVFLSVQ